MKKFFLTLTWLLALYTPRAFAHCHPGGIAWTDTGMEVRVQAVFPNGQVSVVYNNVNFTFNQDQLASPGCWEGLCSGQPVVTTTGMSATVNGFFPNGRVSVKYNGVNFAFDRSELASSVPQDPYCPPYGGIRVGDRVYTRTGLTAQVGGIFPNGQIDVIYNTVHFRFDRSEIATQGCLGNLCTGNTVITRTGLRAQVNGFFPDNRTVSVVYNTVNFQFDYNDLAKTWQ